MSSASHRRGVAIGLLIAGLVADARAQDAAPEQAWDAGPRPETLELTEEPTPDFRRRLVWRWPRFRTSEYYVTAGAGLTLVGSLLIQPNKQRWRGGVLVDDDVRRELALSRYQDRRAARDVSDVLIASLIAYTVLVDGVVVTSGYYGADDVLEQMLLINVEVLAITSAVQNLVAGIASRERPYGEICGGDELADDTRDCERNSRYRSFFSGHSAVAFAAAGLTCSHHMNLKLYGGGAPDAAACAVSLVGATATASLRVVGDVHYTSDVVTGAVWGALAGFGLPYLLHYSDEEPKQKESSLRVHLVPVAMGAGIGGSF